MNVRVLKFHMQIPYEKIVDPYFCLCSSYAPFWSYAPFKTKFENLVCKISQKIFKLEPSYLVHWLGLRRRSPDYFLRTFRQILTKLLHFEIFTPISNLSAKSLHSVSGSRLKQRQPNSFKKLNFTSFK